LSTDPDDSRSEAGDGPDVGSGRPLNNSQDSDQSGTVAEGQRLAAEPSAEQPPSAQSPMVAPDSQDFIVNQPGPIGGGRSQPPNVDGSLVNPTPDRPLMSDDGLQSYRDLFSSGSSEEDVPSTRAASVEPGNVGERYLFQEVLGEGSYGVVYAAFDRVLKRDVAIKTSRFQDSSAASDLFVREAQSACRLRHPNIVTIHDVIKNRRGVFIVSDLIRGKTLHHWLHSQTRSIEETVELIIKLARAMDYAHEKSVVHRDLKPGNIMIDEANEPHILDFGLSQSLDNSQVTISQFGQPIGTPAFMAPEQVRGDRKSIDRRTDVYALGVTLYQALTQQLPFRGEKAEIYHAILNTSPPPMTRWNPKIPASLMAIVARAMSKTREERYESAAALADDLQRFLDGQVVTAYGKWDRRVMRATLQRRALPLALLLTVLVGSVGFASWWSSNSSGPARVLAELACSAPGARLTWTPYDPATGLKLVEQCVTCEAGETLAIFPGFYHVRVTLDGESMEVFRTVPGDPADALHIHEDFFGFPVTLKHRSSMLSPGGIRVLPEVRWVSLAELPSNMKFFPPGRVVFDDTPNVLNYYQGLARDLPPFLMATAEVRWKDLVEIWPDAELPAIHAPEESCRGISWDLAVAYAESRGGSLPDPWQIQWAATNLGKTQCPAGVSVNDIPLTEAIMPYGVVAPWDVTIGEPAVTGLWSGVSEWTDEVYMPIRWDEDQKPGSRLHCPRTSRAGHWMAKLNDRLFQFDGSLSHALSARIDRFGRLQSALSASLGHLQSMI
jgi:hypothetical protein